MTWKRQSLDLLAVSVLIVLSLSWGVNQVAIKLTLSAVPPGLQAGIRSIGAALLLLLWMLIRRQPILEKDGTLWWGIAAGTLFSGEFLLAYWGLKFTHASRAVIFFYMSPFVVAIGAQLFIPSEHLNRLQVAGLCCAFAGIVVAFGESFSLPTHRMLIGDSMLVVAAVLWGATTVLIKASPLADINPAKTLLYQLVVSAVLLPLGSLVMGEQSIASLNPLIICLLLYQVVWVAFITFLAWFWLIHHYPASRIASFTFLTPLFGVLAGIVLLKEPMTGHLLVALVLVGTGIYLVNR